MADSALQQVAALPSLQNAWEEIRRRASSRARDTKGIDNESINTFARNLHQNLKDISTELAAGYKFLPLKAHIITKPNGALRVICVPTIRDRVVQRAILNFLSDGDKCGLVNNVSFGFIRDKNRTAKTAVGRATSLRSRYPWVYKTDITAFFDQVDRRRLRKLITRSVKSRSLHSVLISSVNCEISESARGRRDQIERVGIRKNRGVRQGMPLSPFFANLVLKEFDRTIQNRRIRMVRYADDFIVCGKSKKECYEIHEFCKIELQRIGHTVPDIGPHSKSQIYHPDKMAEFLGVGLEKKNNEYIIVVTNGQLEKIKSNLLRLSSITTLVEEGTRISNFGQKLDGMIAGYESAYEFCDNFNPLKKKLRGWRTLVIMRLFRDGFGIDERSLKGDRATFLGL